MNKMISLLSLADDVIIIINWWFDAIINSLSTNNVIINWWCNHNYQQM